MKTLQYKIKAMFKEDNDWATELVTEFLEREKLRWEFEAFLDEKHKDIDFKWCDSNKVWYEDEKEGF